MAVWLETLQLLPLVKILLHALPLGLDSLVDPAFQGKFYETMSAYQIHNWNATALTLNI